MPRIRASSLEVCRRAYLGSSAQSLQTHYHQGALYIEMEYIRAWFREHLSRDQKKNIISEIASYVTQLRSLQLPREEIVASEIVASASLDGAMDLRIGPRPFGPFDSHQDFHAYIRGNLAIENCTRTFGQQVTECHARKYRSCFTHADLCLRNILVHNGKVAAIVDWGFGGWYPEYWEYTKAHYGQMDLPEWYEGLESALDRYDHELEAEQILWDQCDEPGLLWERERLPEPGLGADNPNTLGH